MKEPIKQKIIYGILAIGILIGGFAVSKLMVSTAPKAQKSERPSVAVLVETVSFEPSSNSALIRTHGRVEAKNRAKVVAEVSGKVVYVSDSLRPSNRVKKGEVLVKIDPLNYQSALKQKEATVEKARADLELELGKVEVAQREFALLEKLLPESNNTALVLREPQLKQAKAALLSAEAELTKARADLERCVIRAPFDGYIESKSISIGEMATSSTPLFSMVGSEGFWIEADVRDEDVRFIDFGIKNANIYLSSDASPLEGSVKGVLPSVDSSTQKVRVLIELEPQKDVSTPIFSGVFATIDIKGADIPNSVSIPSRLVREGGKIWLYKDGKLEFRDLNIIFRGSDFVITDSLNAGEEVITTNLNSPASGIDLRVKGNR